MMSTYGRGMLGGFRFGGSIVMCLVGLLFLALVVLAVVALIKYLRRSNSFSNNGAVARVAFTPTSSVDKAIEIAGERFARGEITAEEFASIKTELRKQ